MCVSVLAKSREDWVNTTIIFGVMASKWHVKDVAILAYMQSKPYMKQRKSKELQFNELVNMHDAISCVVGISGQKLAHQHWAWLMSFRHRISCRNGVEPQVEQYNFSNDSIIFSCGLPDTEFQASSSEIPRTHIAKQYTFDHTYNILMFVPDNFALCICSRT